MVERLVLDSGTLCGPAQGVKVIGQCANSIDLTFITVEDKWITVNICTFSSRTTAVSDVEGDVECAVTM